MTTERVPEEELDDDDPCAGDPSHQHHSHDDDPDEDEWTNREGMPEFNGSFR